MKLAQLPIEDLRRSLAATAKALGTDSYEARALRAELARREADAIADDSRGGATMSTTESPTVTLAPLLLSRAQLGQVLGGCSPSHVDRLDRSGKLGPRPLKLGSCVRWRADEVSQWCAAGCPPRVQWDQREGHTP